MESDQDHTSWQCLQLCSRLSPNISYKRNNDNRQSAKR